MKTLVVAVMAVSAVALPPAVFAENSPATRLSLRGLPGVGVRVQPLSDAARNLGVSADKLEGVIRARLDAAKIQVLSPGEQQRTPGRPGLSIHIAALPLDQGEFLYSVHLDLKQWVALLGNPRATLETALAVPATTWSPDYRFGISPSEEVQADILAATRHMLDEFVDAYRRANPGESPTP